MDIPRHRNLVKLCKKLIFHICLYKHTINMWHHDITKFKRMLGAILGYDARLKQLGEDPNKLRDVYYNEYLKGEGLINEDYHSGEWGEIYGITRSFGCISFKNNNFYLTWKEKYYETNMWEETFVDDLDTKTAIVDDLYKLLSQYSVDLIDLCQRCGAENVFKAIFINERTIITDVAIGLKRLQLPVLVVLQICNYLALKSELKLGIRWEIAKTVQYSDHAM
jgi:hypothetical protein